MTFRNRKRDPVVPLFMQPYIMQSRAFVPLSRYHDKIFLCENTSELLSEFDQRIIKVIFFLGVTDVTQVVQGDECT